MSPPMMSTSNSAMIIFDWDDTILPSSFVDRARADNLRELPQQYHRLFREIEKCTERCLAAAAKHGEVSTLIASTSYVSFYLQFGSHIYRYSSSDNTSNDTIQVIIITNSDEGWVKYSAERYLPNLIPILDNYRIISARTRYEKFYPNQPLCWKAAAFAHEVNEHFCSLEDAHDLLERECSHGVNANSSKMNNKFDDSVPDMDLASTDDSSLEDNSISSAEAESPGGVWDPPRKPLSTQEQVVSAPPPSFKREVISFGDSIEERTAVKIVSDQLDALPKSVMFLSNPTPTQIIGQLTMLTHHMKFVCEHEEDLDLEISLKQAEKCAQGYLARRGMAAQNKAGANAAGDKPTILQRILGTGPTQNTDMEMDDYVC